MKKLKLFSLALMALFTTSVWAANEVTLLNSNFTQWKTGATPPQNSGLSNSNTYTLTDGTNDVASVVGKGCKLNDTKNTPTATGITGYNTNKFRFGSENNYLYITPVGNFVKGGKVRILVSSEQVNNTYELGTVYIGSTSLGTLHAWSSKETCDWQEFDIPASVTGTTAQIKLTRTSYTMFVWGIVVLTNRDCDNPNASLRSDTTVFIGDGAIDLKATSSNTSSKVWSVKKGEAAAVENTDFTWVDGKFNPLVAGTYTISFTQAADGTRCAVEAGDASVTITAGVKTPVTEFTIPASRSARIGEDVNLSITGLDAVATKIGWILAGDTVSKVADYVFTPNAAGSYVFTAYAANEFNTSGSAENSCTITVTISSDATLSTLTVAGKTLTPTFDAAETTYSISGQLGVYELLDVTAAATDAPYATVAIVDNKTNAVTVTVTAENESHQDYTIGYTRKAATTLSSISATTTWDWANAGSATAEQKATGTFPSNAEEFNFADVLISPAESFNAAALSGIAQFANRGTYFQGNKVKFNTTVAGSVQIYYQNTSNRSEDGRRWVDINGTKKGEGAVDQKDWYLAEGNVSAGDVVITFEDKNAAATMLRINKIVFTKGGTVGIENTETNMNAVKRIENGMLIIEKNGIRYNAQGQVIR